MKLDEIKAMGLRKGDRVTVYSGIYVRPGSYCNIEYDEDDHEEYCVYTHADGFPGLMEFPISEIDRIERTA